MKFERIGKYDILGKIGRGAMGEVYRAHDPVLNRDVAIKTISADLDADDTVRKRFEREAQSAARLNHPNVITVYDFGREQDVLYMAMELLEGSDLRQVIGARSLRSLDDKLPIMEQICEGLEAAHRMGIVHRDLKPANIHLQPNNQVKVMDFGLARLSGSEMTRTGMVMGTPHYMSPEQVRGERADARSDIFSLGCVFYELLTGEKPFDADSMHAVLFKVMQEPPKPVRDLAPDVPRVLTQVLEKALAKNPDHRFQDAGALKAALGRARRAISSGHGEVGLPELALPGPEALGARGRPPAAVSSVPPGAERAWSGSGPSFTAVRRPPSPPPARWPLALGGALLLVALLGVGIAVVIAVRPQPPITSPPTTRPAQLDTLAQAVVGTQVELAQKRLEAGDYRQAAQAAERALKLAPQNADARRIHDQAQKVLDGIDAATRKAQAAREAGDDAGVAAAVWELLQLDPTHPLASELATSHEKDLREYVPKARKAMSQARTAAEKAGARRLPEFGEAEDLSGEAEKALKAGRYASAAREFLIARDQYVRARRSVQ